MRYLSVASVLCCLLPALAGGFQNDQTDAISHYLKSLSPDEVKQYKDLAADPSHLFDPVDPKVISNVQGILGVLGYGELSSGVIDAKTKSEVRAFQKHVRLPETGIIDAITYFALSREFDHPPTYTQLRDSMALPKWATAVCFEEKSTDSSMKLIENLQNSADESATDFMVYGPKGDQGIQTEQFEHGRPLAYMKWERQKGSNEVSNFAGVVLGSKHKEGTYLQLSLDWEPKQYFHIRLSSTNTGQTILRTEGRCHSIYEGKPTN
jgi:hypothetical protein